MFPKLSHPFTMMVCGASGSGKTTFVTNIVDSIVHLVEGPVKKIVWCYDQENSIPQNLRDVQYHKGIVDWQSWNGKTPTLIILDDLMMVAQGEKVADLFTKGSHHKNISVVFITQNLFYQGKNCRDISLNVKHFVIFKNPRDMNQFTVFTQLHPHRMKELEKVYIDATAQPFSYLYIDLSQSTPDPLRYQTDVFNQNYSTVYLPQECLKHIDEENEEDTYQLTF